ncbi:MAG TPA: flagellar biosynthesis regulator FlaF [Devosia sp.]|jgi:flagellar protein FlaF|nr:flagellar biosynthesis regulator FlaF [Devosia sp.]
MQNQAVQAYKQAARQTVPPRDLEANLLSAAAAHFQRIRENWDLLSSELPTALKFNRQIWTIFLTSVTDAASPLAMDVRQHVANLGVFVLSQTAELQVAPEPEKLDILVKINRELAAGLRGDAG